jgi:hypothetical protein
MRQQPLADERTLLHVAEPVHTRASVGQRLLGGMKPPLRGQQLLAGGMNASARSEHQLSRGADQGWLVTPQHQYCYSRWFAIPKEAPRMRAVSEPVNRHVTAWSWPRRRCGAGRGYCVRTTPSPLARTTTLMAAKTLN